VHHSSILGRRLVLVLLLSAAGGCLGKGKVPEKPGLGPIPAEWQHADVGAVGQAGASHSIGSTFYLFGSGSDIWDSADGFQFAYQSLNGDGQLTARVLTLDQTDGWAKSGVMIRESLNPDSKFAMTVVTPANGTSLQVRTQTGGGCGLTWGPGLHAPAWVRITRTGGTFSGAASADGVNWTTIGDVSISMGSTVYIGLCVTAHNNSLRAATTIDSVTGGGAPPPPPPNGTISVSTPVSRIVYQRNNSNQAFVPIRGTCSGAVTSVQARVQPRAGGQGVGTAWTVIDGAPSGGTYRGSLTVQGGWYSLDVRAMAGGTELATASVDRVGVGEVFIVVGHSVAQGGTINIEGSTDERGNTIPDNRTTETSNLYNDTADPQYMPPVIFAQYASGVKPAPFGGGSYFWGKLSQDVAQNQNVPVIVYNAAFGGTSLEHWYKSALGIPFDHSFVKSSIRMPYINLYNTLKQYIKHTGMRAVLSDQGANDWPNPDSNQVFTYYKTWVDQARADLGYGALAIVVNRHTPSGNTGIRDAQMRMVNEVPNCFVGPDYDTLAPDDRYDGIHLSEQGCWAAAQKWADALNGGFFSSSQPYLPTFP